MTNNKSVRVLVVDDEPMTNKFIRSQLTDLGYVVAGAAFDGPKALELTCQLKPEVVLMDLHMPNPETGWDDPMAGLKAVRMIQECCPTPVILLTALESPALLRQASAAGVGAYLVKPARDNDLERAIIIALARFDDIMELCGLNTELQAQVAERVRAGQALQKAHAELEQRVEERTAELVQANASLKNLAAQWQSTFDTVADSISLLDLEGTIMKHNQALGGLLAKSADEIGGHNCCKLVHGAPGRAAGCPFNRMQETRHRESHVFLLNGRWIEVTVDPVLDEADEQHPNGKLVGAVHIMSDISERQRAEDALRRYTERLKILHEIDQDILAARSPQTIAQAAVTHILQLIPCQRADVVLYDPSVNEILILAADTDAETTYGQDARYRLDLWEDELERLRQGQVLVWREPLLWGRDLQTVFAAEGLHSAVSVPLTTQEKKWMGVLNLSFEASEPVFTDENETIARQVADQLSIAIQQARLREQVQRHTEELEGRVADRTRELAVLYEVATSASRSLDLEKTLGRSLNWVLMALQGDAGAIHLLDTANVPLRAAGGNVLRLAVQQDIPSNLMAQIESLPAHEGLGGWVIEHDKALVLPDVTSDPRLTVEGLTTPRTFAGVPMRAAGQVVGVLSILREATQPQFSEEEVALLASIADQVGMVVESDRLRRQAQQAAVMDERGRLARELHDSVTQALYSMVLLTEGGRRLAESGDLARARDYFSDLEEITIQALKEMRLLIYELRPSVLEREGLVRALQQRLDAVEGRASVKARLLVEGEIELPPLVEQMLYGLAQEALNNTLKHASATTLTVRVRSGDGGRVELEIMDDGRGFDCQESDSRGGIGLLTMRERAEQVGGALHIISAPGKGTTVRITVG